MRCEASDPTVDSQIVTLQGASADTLIAAAGPKPAAQAIRKVADIGWKPLFFLSNVSVSVAAVIRPAGEDTAVGVITPYWGKDPTDPAWNDDPGMKQWRAFMTKYLPDADQADVGYVY